MRKGSGDGRIQQAVGIAVLLVIALVIASKGIGDMSTLLAEEPNDFWRALVRYFLENLAAGGGEWRGHRL